MTSYFTIRLDGFLCQVKHCIVKYFSTYLSIEGEKLHTVSMCTFCINMFLATLSSYINSDLTFLKTLYRNDNFNMYVGITHPKGRMLFEIYSISTSSSKVCWTSQIIFAIWVSAWIFTNLCRHGMLNTYEYFLRRG